MRDTAAAAGLCLILGGTAMWSIQAALIVAGLLLVLVTILYSLVK